jgi:3-oxoacyl-[acyl-carrier protein] reductase
MNKATPTAFDLTGQAALVTGSGSSRGIGFTSARLLGQMGASVVVTGTTERAHSRAAELRQEGIVARSRIADLRSPRAARELVQFAEREFGRIDILVNNAGMASLGSPEEPNSVMDMTDDEWSLAMRRNLDSAFFVTRATLPGMVRRCYGRIVNVASMAGILVSGKGDVGYPTAKAAMLGMTRSLAIDYAAQGITANAVLPGWIATEGQLPHEVPAGNATPMGRSAQGEEVASGIAFLASPGASYITGTTLIIDGGNTIMVGKAGD